ncbi:hypothetical protein EDB92DRAFT_1795603 [Lactarius akahatsu]|uniref:Uncharacterized protein n=1 Tax=Lactarius akahatsu TaxID=416441 RepID=A0AAD4QF73_9AGAM|nr:hypothetical protein EDB92DRAFT_1795603 [Lactarius akahatsu]
MHTISRITQIWSDRLQLISVYASFFTSIDSVLFSLASNKGNGSTTSKLMQASLTGALIFHAATAILAYVASFVLIRYKLKDAESIPGDSNSKSAIANVYAKYGQTPVDEKGKLSVLESGHVRAEHGHHFHSLLSSPITPFLSTLSTAFSSLLDQPPLLNIDIRRVSLFDFSAVVPCVGESVHDGADAEKNAIALGRLLNRCHNVCSLFALAGFLLLVTGIITYVWAVLEDSVAIFASACVGVCIAFGLAALH